MSESLGNVHGSVSTDKSTGWRRFLAFIGPAYLISVGYMDPGNWATDLAAGSQFGYKLIWVLLLSNLIALLLQSLSARLGIVRGLDLAQASKHAYNRFVNFCLFILAQIAIVACDLAEIIGMAIGLNLLFGLPLIWGVSITMLDTLLILFLMNKGVRKLEGFIVSLVFIVGVSFLTEMFIAKPDVVEIAQGFVPYNISGSALYIAIGILGATVMPHNLYLHSSLVQTRKISRTSEGIRSAIKFNLFDTTIALNLAFFVNAAILILAASAFFRNGYHQVAEIQDAHKLLNKIFGSMAPTLFAIALIASGQSSTITGTLAGQIVMEGHINLRIAPWLRRLITRLLAIIPAYLTLIYAGGDALGHLLVLSQVVLSLQLGFAVIPLIHFTSDKARMGEFVIRNWVKVLSWICAVIIVALNVRLVIQEIDSWGQSGAVTPFVLQWIIIPIAIVIGILLLYITVKPMLVVAPDKPNNVPHGIAKAVHNIDQINYNHIGIAIDFSKNDWESIRHGIMQGGPEAKYTLIHVVETAGARYYGEQVMDMETQSDADNLEQYAKELVGLGYDAVAEIGYGATATAIAQIVNRENIDFVVMGSHGHRFLKDLIFGTTVNSVRHMVNVPVLIVKPQGK
ncbi:Nramp family divalent metal transporter [Mucilaginibacter sp. RS28]|uniref:Divalent metal cation transporter MntH n=1 Tax=Mucilaginibacter straminoryzae TaxID=2932774 RepID=A0A9X2BAM4_9SPHI|nr:Nramp family divalent metal transporter [Mucilaginibacter straminoryzae]MCJ8208922.1 Nramp family divalent metal transporter [Mucilaginibacter straminoryzae]